MPLRLQAWPCRIIFRQQNIPIDSVIKGEIKYYHGVGTCVCVHRSLQEPSI